MNRYQLDDDDDDQMMLSPFGQLWLWALSLGVRDVFTSTSYVLTYPHNSGVGTMLSSTKPWADLFALVSKIRSEDKNLATILSYGW
jgi:hypothetical protein